MMVTVETVNVPMSKFITLDNMKTVKRTNQQKYVILWREHLANIAILKMLLTDEKDKAKLEKGIKLIDACILKASHTIS